MVTSAARGETPAIAAGLGVRGNRCGTPVTDPARADSVGDSTRAGLLVVKLGGRALEAPDAARELAAEVAALRLARAVVLVHGGGGEVSEWSRRLGLAPSFSDGLRVTDAAALEVAVAVLAGLRNKQLVALLRDAGADAVGLAACDGGLAAIAPHPESVVLGHVARVASVRAELLHRLLDEGYVPVLASIGALEGRLWNVNADELAGAVAQALGAASTVFLSDTPGVRARGAVLAEIAAGDVPAWLADPEVQGGMRPKLMAAAAAVASGSGTACITQWQGVNTLRRAAAGELGTRVVHRQETRVHP
jgi:acetylglutamate kinase